MPNPVVCLYLRARAALAWTCWLLAASAPLAAVAHAQTVTGSVQGVVRDTTNAVLPGATILLKGLDTGQERQTVSDGEGFYSLPYVPLGPYSLSATLTGFGPVIQERIEVTLNDTRVVHFTLDPAATDTVTVRGESRATINTTNQEIKSSLTSEQILDKPTLSPGSFLSLADTFAGFQENPTSGQNNPTTSSGSSINFNGTGSRGATFQINGVNNDDASENQNRQGAALSTIKEFQVIQNTFSAEFGRGYGAVVLVQTKSGTNQMHGDLYNFYQNSQWNARSFFATTKPKNSRDQYGGTAGFPIARNQLFAFISLDRTRDQGTLNYARDLFLPSELSQPRLTRGNDTPANRAFIESVLNRFPAGATPNDPRSTRTYATTTAYKFPDQDHSARLDWNAPRGGTVTTRYQYTRQKRQTADVILGEQAIQNNKQSNVGLTWTHPMSNRIVGEFRYGLGLRSTNVDIAAGNDTPVMRFVGSPVSGAIIGNAGSFPIHRSQTDHQFVYNVTASLGNHLVKAGTDIRRQQLDDLADSFSRGFYNFTSTCGGVIYPTAYAAFLDGCVGSYQRGYGPFFLENRLNEYNVYAEDSWRVHPTLTLNLGLRYELVKAPYDAKDRIDYGFGDDTNNAEARLGFAWAPDWESGLLGRLAGGTGNASLRAGYGVYDGRIFQSIFSQSGAGIRFNPPNAANLTFATVPGILNVSDPTQGFVFVPGPPTTRVSLTLANPDLQMPRTHQWNLTLERKVPLDSSVRLSYTGTRGVGFLRFQQANLPVLDPNGPFRIAADVLCAGTGFVTGQPTNAQCPSAVPIADNEISFRVPRTNERRPDARYTTNLLVSNDNDSWFHGLQVEWIKRASHGLRFEAAYTWSKAIDTTSEATPVGAGDGNQLGPDKRFRKGLSRFHTPHRLTLNASWLIPFFRDRTDLAGQVLGGWQLAGVLKLISGTPFTVIDGGGRDLNFDGFTENRPVLLDPSILYTSVDNPNRSTEQLPAAAFRTGTLADYGGDIVGRNTFFVDGVNNLDLALLKTFTMPFDAHRLTLRLEVYNALNTPQFGFPNLDVNTATFGRLVSTATAYRPRTYQIGLRYTY